MQLPTHHSIADLYDTLHISYEKDIQFAILSIPKIHPQIPYKSSKLRADYFSFILTLDGSGTYYLDDRTFPFASGSIYFTNPGHTKSYELYESREAYIITVTEIFLRDYVQENIFDIFPFLLAEVVPPNELSESRLSELRNLYRQILDESEKTSPYKNKILGNMLEVLLLKLKEDFWLDYNPKLEGSQHSRIVKSFKQILDQEFRNIASGGRADRPQVIDFANQLHLHPNYLNTVIRSKTGKTINEWITTRTINTAKSLLRNTSLSSKEIAYKLGFREPTHFNRFFKKQMKTTPTLFRKSLPSKQ